jgi:outer membrane protein OmpA-like peptidoglycan-associated protein
VRKRTLGAQRRPWIPERFAALEENFVTRRNPLHFIGAQPWRIALTRTVTAPLLGAAALLFAACASTPEPAIAVPTHRPNVTDANSWQRAAASSRQLEADIARNFTADAQNSAQVLQRQLDDLETEATDRGSVLTLGDVLFASGTAELNAGGVTRLGTVAEFMIEYRERVAAIDGYTDSVGTNTYNQGLSQRRAETVKAYLVQQGVAAHRLTVAGRGESAPLGDNASAMGRQQNRRVEVVINQ